MGLLRLLTLTIALTGVCGDLLSQELQPRNWAPLPSGINFAGVGSGWTYGNILFDPALLIEDAEVDLAAFAASYIRTFDWSGKQARLDFTLPYANGRWNGLVNGEPTAVRRHGFADAQVRLSANLLGAPAMKLREFAGYMAAHPIHTSVGAGIELTIPSGEYSSERLINLGNNRWVLRPELGVLHQRRKWQFEVTGTVFLFGDNDEFWRGSVRKQDPLWFMQGHAIYTFKPGLWASLSGGFAAGGRTEINGIAKDDDRRIRYWKLTLGVPINARQGLSFAFVSARTNTFADANLDRFSVGWSLMFGQ